jgi:hypothetical protein
MAVSIRILNVTPRKISQRSSSIQMTFKGVVDSLTEKSINLTLILEENTSLFFSKGENSFSKNIQKQEEFSTQNEEYLWEFEITNKNSPTSISKECSLTLSAQNNTNQPPARWFESIQYL